MKKILVLFIAIFMLFSCEQNDRWENVVEESARIVDDYVDVLESTPQEARDAVNSINQKTNDLEKELQGIY